MLFDTQKALAELKAKRGSEPVQTAPRWQPAEQPPRVARIARIAPRPESPAPRGRLARRCEPQPYDDAVLLGLLRLSGPRTYGAAAAELGWGATRTFQAEGRLLAARLVRHGDHGRTEAAPAELIPP